MKELVTKRLSGNVVIGYFMSVIQSPSRKDNAQDIQYSGLDYGDPDVAPWVVLRSRFTKYEEVTFPVSMCSRLLNHLITCVTMDAREGSIAEQVKNASNSDLEGETRLFDLSKLLPTELEDATLDFALRILTERPDLEEASNGETGITEVRRWIQSGPLTMTTGSGTRPQPLHTRNAHLELYEALLPNLIVFLSKFISSLESLFP